MDTTVVDTLQIIIPTGGALLNMILPAILATLVVPIITWVRAWLPMDFPIGVPFITLAVAFGLLWAFSLWLAPELTAAQIFVFALGTDKIMQLVYTGQKTVKKIRE